MSVLSPRSAAQAGSASGSSVISAAMYGCRSPTTIAWETNFDVLRSFSRFCGATFLPPAVTMMSFLRSVIVMKPSSSISAMSPLLSQPSAPSTSAVASGSL